VEGDFPPQIGVLLDELQSEDRSMREVMKRQASLGEFPIEANLLDPKSRDDIPKFLVGLQYSAPNLSRHCHKCLGG
jgi:hypothetical protein